MNSQMQQTQLAFRAMTDISATILIPAVVAAFLGKVLDGRFGTGRVIIGILLTVTFVATGFLLIRKAKMYAELFKNQSKRE